MFWTIPVEFKFYFVLPLAVLGFHLIAVRRVWLVALGVAGVSAVTVAVRPADLTGSIALVPFLPIFLMGSLVSLVHTSIRDRPRLQAPPFPALFEAAALLALAAVVATVPPAWRRLTGTEVRFDHFHTWIVFYGLTWNVFILGVLNGQGVLRGLFASRPARLIGIISFSIYLFHYPVLLAVRFLVPLPGTAQAMLAIALTAPLCCGTYLLVERPFMRIRLKTPGRSGPAS